MLIPKKNRRAIFTKLFQDGVLVAKKDYTPTAKHHEITDVPNLYVIKLMQSLKSRDYVTETFNWQFHYWYLKNEGIEYLRAYLHLPEEIVPATLKRPRAPTTRGSTTGASSGRGAPRSSRPDGEKKVGGASADFKPDFVKGGASFGRGRGRDGGRGEYRREQPEGRGRGGPRA